MEYNEFLLLARTRPLFVTAAGAVVLLLLGLTLRLTSKKVLSWSQKTKAPPKHAPWLLQFPPSRRHVLADLKLKGVAAAHPTPSPDVLRKRAVPTKRTADWDLDNQYTPTGFSTQDIRALGRFPDYSVLTGVRYPEPYGPQFDIKKALFRPFRPFRWNYHQTMAYYKFEPDWWVELEKNYHSTMAARLKVLENHSDLVFFSDPGSELGCRELMEMLVLFICKRYPQYFSLENDDTILHNRLLNTKTDLISTPPLKVIFLNIPEDYAMVLRNEDSGFYHLRAAMVCSSVGWDVGMHRGKPLRAIHDHVPDYPEKMALSMDRFFSKMAVDAPIQRGSWSLEDHAPLFSSPRMVDNWKRSAFAENKESLTIENIKLRCDYQTLRRLPLSGAIVFNFKAVFTPITELRDEPFMPALLLKVLQEGKKSLIDYKTLDHVKEVTMKACEEWAQEQVEKGMVPKDWEIGTVRESPFFPGWEKKWHAQQGF